MTEQKMWQAKLAAYIHDPASKALILMRGMSHEQGSVAELRRAIFNSDEALDVLRRLDPVVRRADRWASAADRPSLPMTVRSRVVFAREPALIHPLTGGCFSLETLTDGREDDAPAAIEALNFDHFREFIVRDGENIDWRRTFLAFWRFGRVPPAPDLGLLWQELPADTRSPDHSIWEHLSLTSAFAGALQAGGDDGCALLLVSFGPVQGFIAQARSVSDLWAGSHLLSTLSWQGMKVVCERYGPDAVLFPSLHGVPLVDVWLGNEVGLKDIWPGEAGYPAGGSDRNPLFAAALPNRFLALVPASGAEALAREIGETARAWIRSRVDEALEEIGLAGDATATGQVERQLTAFPEVNWSVVPWRLAGSGDRGLDDAPLLDALRRLGRDGEYLADDMGRLVKKEIEIEGEPFYTPNPGVAYPGLYELSERVHAAAKTARPFDGRSERGYRCSVCGEREWLTGSESALGQPPGSRGHTVWAGLHERLRIVKKGEHLCALCALKRFWPRIFTRWAADQSGDEQGINRYVVSTHAMALASSLWRYPSAASEDKEKSGCRDPRETLEKKLKEWDVRDTTALPLKLYRRFQDTPEDLHFFRRLPVLLDRIREEEEDRDGGLDVETERREVEKCVEKLLGARPEAYYAMVLMDGDRMGRWLAAAGDVPHLETRFHEKVRGELVARDGLQGYLAAGRPSSPAWHQAISAGLNSFAVELARVVVEEFFMGKLIYAGGDDLLAMVAVHDLPGLMLALRCAYSGAMPPLEAGGSGGADHANVWQWLTGDAVPDHLDLRLSGGYALLRQGRRRRLLRLMGEKATASMGAVIAHHKTPLGRVLSALREAEQAAKNAGGRDAFALGLMKRSGGESRLVGNWRLDAGLYRGDMGLLLRLRDLLACHGLSRRAAYILTEVVRDVPVDALAAVIRRQLFRQGVAKEADKNPRLAADADALARDLAARAAEVGDGVGDAEPDRGGWSPAGAWLRDMFITAEFLARAGRSGGGDREDQGGAA
ncbi:type III-B CRISPR-associated protein Cas10/Cmr2 [Thermodesulfobacteriota bacterium B35]